MATIKYLLQSDKDNANIYMRLSLSQNKSIKRKTGLIINSKNWSKKTAYPIAKDESLKKLKSDLLKNNKKIRWIPEHIKEGRFGKWLEGSRDWAVSRNRFWGAPLPVWQSKDGDNICIGSVEELEKLSIQKLGHRDWIKLFELKKDLVDKLHSSGMDCKVELGEHSNVEDEIELF